MPKWAVSGWIWVYAIAVAAVMAGAVLRAPRLYAELRDLGRDSVQRAYPRAYDAASAVVIVDIDEAALAEFGQWPWPRNVMAQLTQRLFDHGAAVVAFDVVFPEADRTSPEEIAQSWARFGRAAEAAALAAGHFPAHDALFAQALRGRAVVLAVAGKVAGKGEGANGADLLPRLPAGVAITGGVSGGVSGVDSGGTLDRWPEDMPRFDGALRNLPALDGVAAGIGAISLARNPDAIVRNVPMVMGLGDILVPAMPAEVLRVLQGAGGHVLRTSQASGEVSGGHIAALALRTGAYDIPLGADGSFAVHFAGSRAERVMSAAQVMAQSPGQDDDLATRIGGKIVLVGASAQGLYDIRATPLEAAVPGVTLHAEVIEQILAGDFLRRPDWMGAVEALLAGLGAAITALALSRGRAVLALVCTAGLAASAAAASPLLFNAARLIFDPLAVMLAPVLVFVPGAAAGFWAKERARRLIRARFAHFIPADLLARIEADPQRTLTPQGSERDLTILFVDLRGFTAMAEGMAARDVVARVNAFLAEVSDALVGQRATIDKYIGDAVMAFWNAPADQPDHAAMALRALPAILASAQRAAAGGVAVGGALPLMAGIGVNTGRAAVGLIGSRERLSYSCIGAPVNLAARLQGLTQYYGVWNCVGPDTARACPDGFTALPLDLILVKGVARAVQVYSVFETGTSGLAEVATILALARAAYLDRDWDGAAAGFAALGQMALPMCQLSVLSDLYLDRIAQARLRPPPADWDGAHLASAKSY